MKYDAIIIGAGPSGASTSISLASAGWNVLLLEKSRFPREKLCGEFLTPECLPFLERLAVREKISGAGAIQIRKFTIYSPEGAGFEVPLSWIADGESSGLSLSRGKTDQILLDRARESGVEVREEFQVSQNVLVDRDQTIIEGQQSGLGRESFTTSLLIDASGRNGVFSRQSEQSVFRLRGGRLFGCKVHLRRIDGLNDRGELYFFGDGYGGLTDVEGDRTNLCLLTTEKTLLEAKGDRQKLLDLTINQNPIARRRLENHEVVEEWHGTGPLIFGRQHTLPGVLAVGDAGAFIDPFTGSGMLLALSSGDLAGRVIDHHFRAGIRDGGRIIAAYLKSHARLFSRRYQAVSMLRNLAFRPIPRRILVSLLSRHQRLARTITRITRR